MTAFLVLLAQTEWVFSVKGERKVSINFQHKKKLSKKKRSMRGLQLLSPERNRSASFMSLLDMQGLVGAATIIGCLKYGASFSGLDEQKDSIFLICLKDDDLVESPDDST